MTNITLNRDDVIHIMHRKFAEHMMPGEEITEHDIRLMALVKDLEREYSLLEAESRRNGSSKGLEWVKEFSREHGADMYICPKCLHTYSKPLPKCPSCGAELN